MEYCPSRWIAPCRHQIEVESGVPDTKYFCEFCQGIGDTYWWDIIIIFIIMIIKYHCYYSNSYYNNDDNNHKKKKKSIHWCFKMKFSGQITGITEHWKCLAHMLNFDGHICTRKGRNHTVITRESGVNPNSSLIYPKIITIKNKTWSISHCNNKGVIKRYYFNPWEPSHCQNLMLFLSSFGNNKNIFPGHCMTSWRFSLVIIVTWV